VIFMLHRIVTGVSVYPGYELSVDDLDAGLKFVKATGWDIVSIDEACRRLRVGDEHRFACFTFDDGYVDNYTLALPVFAKYNAPMCVYVTTGILERSIAYWWGGLIELVTRNEGLEVPFAHAEVRKFSTRTLQEKRATYEVLDNECHRNPSFLASLDNLFRHYGIEVDSLLDQHALTLNQARQFASHPLVTIGSHAVTHRQLASLSDEEAEWEVSTSRGRLESALDVPVRHIAYPFGGPGACGDREFALAQTAGYESGVTTRRGNVRAEHSSRMCQLPRQVLHANLANVRNCLFGTDALTRATSSQ
jgi:peptidoglycan/xylan/chitin deacetylase (PgdA/CDA1 family)